MSLKSATIDTSVIANSHKDQNTGTCATCGMVYFPIKYQNGSCIKCGDSTCDSCLSMAPNTDRIPTSVFHIPSPLCSKCLSAFNPEMKNYQEPIDKAETIIVYPQISKGKTGIDPNRPTLNVKSDGCDTYQHAEYQLKVSCAFLGYDMVVERSYSKQQKRGSSGGVEWIAVGKLGYKLT